MTKCKSCGADIDFIRTSEGKLMPVDAEEVWVRASMDGSTFVLPSGAIVKGFVVGDAEDRAEVTLLKAYVSHFATCPNAAQHRVAEPQPEIIRDEKFDFGIRGEYLLYKEGYFVENERISKFTRDVKPLVSNLSSDRKRFPTSRRAINMAQKIGFDAWRADGVMLYRAADGMRWNV